MARCANYVNKCNNYTELRDYLYDDESQVVNKYGCIKIRDMYHNNADSPVPLQVSITTLCFCFINRYFKTLKAKLNNFLHVNS